MFGSIRRISKFASAEELGEAVEVLQRGGVVGVPSLSGILLVGSEHAYENLRAMCGGTLPARILASIEPILASGALPPSLGRWFTKLALGGAGEVWMPALKSAKSFTKEDKSSTGPIKRLARRLGLDSGRSRLEPDEPREAQYDLPDLSHHALRMTDNPVTRNLVNLVNIPLFASLPLGPDGLGLTIAEVAKTIRNGPELILSLASKETARPARISILMRAGMACKPAFTAEEMTQVCQPHRILFVCIGNINRSPYAEAHIKGIMRQEAEEAKAAGFQYIPAWAPGSAGTAAIPGTPATDGMVAAARHSLGWAFIEKHGSRRFTPILAQDYDEIMPLDASVAQAIREFDTGGIPITFSKHQDLFDPMGRGADDYFVAAEGIEDFITSTLMMPGVALPQSGQVDSPRRDQRRRTNEDFNRI